jgi:hypothetical protein
MTGGWRELQNEKLHNLNFSPSIIRKFKSRRMRWAGQVAGMRGNIYRILKVKPDEKRPLGVPRSRPADNIKMDRVERTGLIWLLRTRQ